MWHKVGGCEVKSGRKKDFEIKYETKNKVMR